MPGGVEADLLVLPLINRDSSSCGAPHPPLRQAAGRYTSFALVRCEFIDKHSIIAKNQNLNRVFIRKGFA